MTGGRATCTVRGSAKIKVGLRYDFGLLMLRIATLSLGILSALFVDTHKSCRHDSHANHATEAQTDQGQGGQAQEVRDGADLLCVCAISASSASKRHGLKIAWPPGIRSTVDTRVD